jgi:hypothetical protein
VKEEPAEIAGEAVGGIRGELRDLVVPLVMSLSPTFTVDRYLGQEILLPPDLDLEEEEQ